MPDTPAPTLSEQELAARYGWALAVLNSNSELRATFDRAVAETWAPDRFVAEVRNTEWYKWNSESMRQAHVLKHSDPTTYWRRVEETKNSISAQAAQMGAMIDGATLGQLGEQAIIFGWNAETIRGNIGRYIQYRDGQMWGKAAEDERTLRDYAGQMGIRMDDGTIQNWVRKSASGEGTVESALATIRSMAKSAFPSLAEQIDQGMTVAEMAAPYRQSMAQLLELNAESVDLFDPTIRSALAGTTPDGKPGMKSLWQFENQLRQDSRWLKTNGAREQAMGTARQVLSDFGLAV